MTDRIDPYYIAQLEQIAKMIGWPRLIKEAQARHNAEESMKPPEKYVPSTPFFDLRGEFAKRKVSLPEGFLAHPYESFRKDVDEGFHIPPSLFVTVRSRIVRGEDAIKLAEEKNLELKLFKDESEKTAEKISVATVRNLQDNYRGPEYNLEEYLGRVHVVEQTVEPSNLSKENE